MAFTHGVHQATNWTTGSSVVITLTGTTAGRHIVLGGMFQGSVTITSVTISGESNATLLTDVLNATSNVRGQLAYLANNTGGGTKTITVNLSGTPAFGWFFAEEFAGGELGAGFFDAEAGTSGNSTNPTVNLTTGRDNALIVGLVHHQAGTPTAGTPYTPITVTSQVLAEYDLDGSTAGSRAVDFVQGSSNQWTLVTASFEPPIIADAIFDLPVLRLTNGTAIFSLPVLLMKNADAVFVLPALTVTALGTNRAEFVLPALSVSSSGGVVGAPALENRSAQGSLAPHVSIELLTRTATGVILLGATLGASERATYSASGATLVVGAAASGASIAKRYTATGSIAPHVSVVMGARQSSGVARGAVSGAVVRKGYIVNQKYGFTSLEQRVAYGVASSVAGATFLTAAMNTRSNYVTEYTAHEFNSYARIGNSYYGAGAAGLVLLDGTTDAGASIPWAVRTGQMDGKDPGLKRLPEVLLGLRNTGPVRVRVRPDDNTSYDYMLPAIKLDTIHQHRVTPGKGMRSRYFSVELQGVNNSKVEVDSMQVNMTKTTRRLG